MKKFFVLSLILLFVINLNFVSSDSIDDEFKKLANYAGEYESGNINYIQLLIYASSIKGKMNEILGATGREIGGVLKQEQIKKILGEPVEETKWVWLEGEEREIKLDNAVPVWKNDEICGVIEIMNRKNGFSEEDIRIAEVYTRLFAFFL